MYPPAASPTPAGAPIWGSGRGVPRPVPCPAPRLVRPRTYGGKDRAGTTDPFHGRLGLSPGRLPVRRRGPQPATLVRQTPQSPVWEMQGGIVRRILPIPVQGMEPIPVGGIGTASRPGRPHIRLSPGILNGTHTRALAKTRVKPRTKAHARIGTRVKLRPNWLGQSGTGSRITGLYGESHKNESFVPVFSSVWRCWRS